MTDEKPTPGSDAALDAGCRCAVLDNNHGRGCGRLDDDGKPMFWVSGDCPLHALTPTPAEKEAR